MNYIKHLTGFFDKIILDPNLNPTHISLYIALFQFWNINRFKNPISITRDEVMHISKIGSKATYHKCMKELNEKKYIKYMPSFNPFKGSMVVLLNFSEDQKTPKKQDSNTQKNRPKTEQLINRQETSNETGTEQALVPSINNINKTNDLNISNLDKLTENFKMHSACSNYEKSKIEQRIPAFDEIKKYFRENNFPELEAQKFFNYFSSNGWLVGGKTPMVDWKSSSQNWMLNTDKFSTPEKTNRAKHLNTAKNKNYSEPL